MTIAQKALIKNGEKYLMLLRSADQPVGPLQWDFPGGRQEKDEDLILSLKREVKEETNLDIEPGKIVFECEINVAGHDMKFFMYDIEKVTGDLRLSHEHSDFRWMTIGEMRKEKLFPCVQKFVTIRSIR
jgi:8-oxo-dGTP diphosphatase